MSKKRGYLDDHEKNEDDDGGASEGQQEGKEGDHDDPLGGHALFWQGFLFFLPHHIAFQLLVVQSHWEGRLQGRLEFKFSVTCDFPITTTHNSSFIQTFYFSNL